MQLLRALPHEVNAQTRLWREIRKIKDLTSAKKVFNQTLTKMLKSVCPIALQQFAMYL